MRQLVIWYWNAKNLPKSKIDVVGKTRWWRWFSGTYFVCGMLGYDRDDKYMYYIWATTTVHVRIHYNVTTTMIHSQCMNPLTTSCCGTSKYKLTTRLNTTSLYWMKWNRSAWLLMLLVHLTPEWKRKLRTNQDLRRKLKCVWKLCRVTVWSHAVIIGTMKKCYGSCIAFALLCGIQLGKPSMVSFTFHCHTTCRAEN